MNLFKKSEAHEGIYKTLKVKVSGMHCDGCDQRIQKSLSKIDGLRDVQADFKTGEVRMHFDESKVGVEKIRGTIRKDGFIATGVEQNGT
jgi:copper chaperone CopZ